MSEPKAETYAVKVRAKDNAKKGKTAWKFLGSGGSITHLRLHALQYTKQIADLTAGDVERENPEYETNVVLFWKGRN